MTALVEVEDLSVEFYPNHPDETFRAVEDVWFSLEEGEVLGLVGESGCGKSLSAMSLVDLIPETARSSGTLKFDGVTRQIGQDDLGDLRGRRVGMIFQEPMTALNPLYTIEEQLSETLEHLHGWPEDRIKKRCIQLLKDVQLDRVEERLGHYPHELSGGQRQRVMIALALAGDPELLIADEPTTALDVTTESKIMDLFDELSDEGLSILIISHDLPLVGGISDRIVVMYSGYTVETGPSGSILDTPEHPYTRGLVKSSTALTEGHQGRLPEIGGEVPDPEKRPEGCPFHPRCGEVESRCDQEFPPEYDLHDELITACWARES